MASSAMPSGEVAETSEICPGQLKASCTSGFGLGQGAESQSP
jgi:hypothetical protein